MILHPSPAAVVADAVGRSLLRELGVYEWYPHESGLRMNFRALRSNRLEILWTGDETYELIVAYARRRNGFRTARVLLHATGVPLEFLSPIIRETVL